MSKFLKKKENILYIITIIIFIILSTIIGLKHENWADEAQAWLLARDVSFKDLIFTYLHTDGHPCLWYLVLKFFQLIGLKYNYMFIISIIFNTIGIALILFFSKFPKWFKVLLPFTYFIFYQYTVISRGYCLILPLLAILAILWNKRHEKVIPFTITLLLLLSTEAYTFLAAGALYLIYSYETIKNSKYHNKSHIISLVILFISFCFTIYYVFPRPDNKFNPHSIHYFLSSSFFTGYFENYFISGLGTFITISLVYLCYKKDIKGLIQLALIMIPVIIFLTIKYSRPWHLGIVFLLFIFCTWIHQKENDKFAKILLLLSLSFQIPWAIISSNYDFHNAYDSSYEMSNFIKKYDYENLRIKAVGFYTIGLNAFLDSNIYENFDDNLGFYYWHKNAKYYQTTEIKNKKNWDYVFDSDIVVISTRQIIDEREHPDFNCYYFKASSFVEYEPYENLQAQIFVSKKIDNVEK